ncbi:Gfo/Idh/MocA family protein [candidate division KSB1 bacterium]
MKSFTRRDFIKNSVVSAAALTALSRKNIAGANDKVVLGVMGVGGRGTQLIRHLVKRSDVRIKYICDANTSRYSRAAEIVVEDHGYKPTFVQDFRRILDDPEVDAIVIATYEYWHALATIMACQAGKDVYVEKPMSLSIWDGRKMVEAARKYNRIVQIGTQNRSNPDLYTAAEYIKSGKLGDVYLARVYNMMLHNELQKGEESAVPDGMDYELWCGPGPKILPYRPGSWWRGLWDFSCGGIVGDLAHQMDALRVLIGKTYPETVSNEGGVFYLKDGREAPDTQFATYKFDEMTLVAQSSLWAPYMLKTPVSVRNSDRHPEWLFSSTKIEICGTKGMLFYGRHGGGWQVYAGNTTADSPASQRGTGKNELVADVFARQGGDLHVENFVNCIRTRQKPNADVEEVHISMILCHLANISYRVGNRKLKFDSKTETFIGDNEANKYLKANYRKPWVIPDKV